MAWLPFAAGLVLGAGAAPKLLLKIAPRYVAALGALLSALAAFWFSAITVDMGYWLHLAPAMFVLALGFGLGVLALTQAAVYRVDADKAGIASALLNSAQQIGVALGLAVLAGVAATVTAQPEKAAPGHRRGTGRRVQHGPDRRRRNPPRRRPSRTHHPQRPSDHRAGHA
ncbi:MFS transporter [Streptomyces prasinus]|uniref:hypothetical protein n=1 Tax=Streptomyces prasinus TaxID=67345 RepID=UPI0036A6CABB